MSTKPINLSEDIQRLINDGYSVNIDGNCLIVRDIPYLDESLTPRSDGVLVDAYPRVDHTFYFNNTPYTRAGKKLHVAGVVNGWNGHAVTTQLSFKKSDGKNIVPYSDHYDKVTYYIAVIGAHARMNDESQELTARRYRPIDASRDENTPFQYQDLNSSRAGINHVSKKLNGKKLAIVGLGGTGSYMLDLLSKTPVSEIHLYDNDTFHVHNAFRAPGAAHVNVLEEGPQKVTYFSEIYTSMHKGVIAHTYRVIPKVIDEEFGNYDFVFLCIDASAQKRMLIMKLIERGIPFIDCGIAVDEIDGALNGTARLTTLTAQKNDHLDRRVHCEPSADGDYDSNIQIAELNALSAALAVIKWKRLSGFYHDHETEHHSTYMFNSNSLSNDEKI